MREVLIKAMQRMHLGQSSATPGSRSLPVVRASDGEIRTLTDAHLSGFGLLARIGGSWGYSAVVTDSEKRSLTPPPGQAMPLEGRYRKGGRSRGTIRLGSRCILITCQWRQTEHGNRAGRCSEDLGQGGDTNAAYVEEVKKATPVNSLGTGLDWEGVCLRLVASTVAAAGASSLPSPLQVPTFVPSELGSMLDVLVGTAAIADLVQRRRSPWAGKLGEHIAYSEITMVDEPGDPRAVLSAPYDDKGVPTVVRPVVENGVLRLYLYDAYSSLVEGRAPSGNGLRRGPHIYSTCSAAMCRQDISTWWSLPEARAGSECCPRSTVVCSSRSFPAPT